MFQQHCRLLHVSIGDAARHDGQIGKAQARPGTGCLQCKVIGLVRLLAVPTLAAVSALVIAVGKNNSTIASLLLEAGADPDLPDKLGFSARKYAKLFHDQAMSALMDRYPPRS